MTTENKTMRYSVESMQQILSTMYEIGHIKDFYIAQRTRWVNVTFPSGSDYDFDLDWLREEFAKVDPQVPSARAEYQILFLSQRYEELFMIFQGKYMQHIREEQA